MSYIIYRHQFNGGRKAIKRVSTLEEAQAHCRREDTHGGSTEDGTAWFDGYEEEPMTYTGAPDECSVHWPTKLVDGRCPDCTRGITRGPVDPVPEHRQEADVMSFAEFAARVRHPVTRSGPARQGQRAFNLLTDVRPDLADFVRSSSVDPFYDDALVEPFLTYLKERWDA